MQLGERGNVLLETLVALSILSIGMQGHLGLNYALLKRVGASVKSEKALREFEKEIALVHWQVKKGNLDQKICKNHDPNTKYIYAECSVQNKTYKLANF